VSESWLKDDETMTKWIFGEKKKKLNSQDKKLRQKKELIKVNDLK